MKLALKVCRSLARRTSRPHESYRRLVQRVPGSRREASEFVRSAKVFFIVSTGRTGSAWLSRLLNADATARVEHEPVLWEQVAHRNAIHDPHSAEQYVKHFRLWHMFLQWRDHRRHGCTTFGEVNSAIRRHVPVLQEVLPNAQFIHVVRDGTEFVRSVMSRSTYGGSDPVYGAFRPPSVDSYSNRWDNLTEFERTCWAWQWSNRFMRETIGKTVRFEDILRSYEAFDIKILREVDIKVDEEVWRESVGRPRNTTSTYAIGKWEDWTPEQQEVFLEICGDEMRACGYDLRRYVSADHAVHEEADER